MMQITDEIWGLEPRKRLDQSKVTKMICSNCGKVMFTKEPEKEFEIYSCSWPCKHCGELWYSTDIWIIEEEKGTITPYRDE